MWTFSKIAGIILLKKKKKKWKTLVYSEHYCAFTAGMCIVQYFYKKTHYLPATDNTENVMRNYNYII